jgi:hypothetical protein
MNPTPIPTERIQVSGLIPSTVAEPSRNIAEAAELIPLTIPLDRPEQPVQSELAIDLPELEPQLTGDLARDDDDWT